MSEGKRSRNCWKRTTAAAAAKATLRGCLAHARLRTALLAVAGMLSLPASAMGQGSPPSLPVFNNAPMIALPSICSTESASFFFALGNVTNHANGIPDLVMICGQNIVTVPGMGNGMFPTPMAPIPISIAAQITQISLADIDGDGNLDLVALVATNLPTPACNVDVFLGNGDGTFSSTPTSISEGISSCNTSTAPGNFFVADFNHDGKPDIAIQNSSSATPSIIVLINQSTPGNGSTPGMVSFSAPHTFLPPFMTSTTQPQYFSGMAVGNFTGQTVPDLAVAISTLNVSGAGFTNSVFVLQNNGVGTGFNAFSSVTLPSTANTGALVGLEAAHFSSPDSWDVAGVDLGDDAIFVLYGHGTGYLTTCSSGTPPITSCQNTDGQTITGLPLIFARQLLAGNFNGPNGPPGLLFQSANECMSVLLGAAGGGLQTTATTYVIGNSPTGVVLNSVKNNGHTDAIAAWNSGLSVFLNNTGGTLEGTQALVAGTTPTEISLLQNYFGDGEQDLAINAGITGTAAAITVFGAPASGPNGTFPQNSGPIPAPTGESITAMTSGCVLANSSPCSTPFVAYATYESATNTAFGYAFTTATGGPPVGFGGALSSQQITAIAAGDFNGDEITDLAFAIGSTNTILVFTGNGDGTFSSTPVTISLGAKQNPVALAVADFNGDGKADIAVLNQTAGMVGILLNNTPNCSGGAPLCFAPMASYPIGFSFPSGFTVGDFTGDTKKPDIAVVGGSSVAILLNQGGGVFPGTAPTPIPLPQYSSGAAIATGDFNGDGVLDLAVALPYNPDSLEILNGIGNGNFATATATFWSVGANPAAMVVANFKGSNGDGLPDIAVADLDPEGNTVALLLNGTAAATTPPPPSTAPFANYSPSNSSFDFGPVIVGQSPTYTITLSNTGTGPLALNGISFGLTTPPGFSFTTTCTVPSTINPGDSCTATVQFAPTFLGPSAVSLGFADNAGPGESNLASMTGNPFFQLVSFTGTGVAPPTITSVTPNIGAQGQQGLQVTITGANFVAGSTTVTFGGGNAGITVAPGSLVVNSPTSLTATLNIAPTTPAGNYDVVVTVTGAPPSAPLIGGFTVAIPVSTDNEMITVNDQVTVTPLINFAGPAAFFSASTVGFANGSPQTLTVSNVGGAPLTFSGAPVISAVSGTFAVAQTVCYDGSTTFPTMLPSGGACTLTISYTASAPSANDSGTIVFTDNAALSSPPSTPVNGGYTQLIMLGTGPTVAGQPPSGTVTVGSSSSPLTEQINVQDQVTVTPLLVNFAPPAAFFSASTVGFANGSPQTLTVSNVGGAPLTFSGAPVISAVSGTFAIAQTVCYDGTTTFPTMLPSGGACTLTISYTASATSANDSGTILFTDNAALSSPASTGSAPNYTQSIALSGTGPTVAGQPPSGTVTVPTVQETITVNDRVGLSATTLSSSSPYAAVSTSIILTATVQAAATGNPTPTGTVTFFDGQTPLTGTSTSPNPATLANGTASYTTSSLAVGVHLLTAVYSGDMNFPGSSSQVLVETISSGKFSLSASPSSLTIPQGGSGSTTITITWEGYTGPPVTLSCQTLPNNAVCVFIPLNPPGPSSETVTLTPSGTGATVKLTIYTTGLNGVGSVGGPAGWLDLQSTRPGRVPPILPAAMLLLIGMLALAARQRNEKKWIARLALLALLAGLGMLTACYHYGTPILPGTRFTPTGQSTVVISASGGATTQTLNLTVTITPAQ